MHFANFHIFFDKTIDFSVKMLYNNISRILLFTVMTAITNIHQYRNKFSFSYCNFSI